MRRAHEAWLLLGEATYRYSVALMRSGRVAPGTAVVATSYGDLNSEEKIANAAELRDKHGVEVRDNVDSTKLAEAELGRVFDRVFFMFPHGPRKGRVDLCRTLLTDTCRSVREVLDQDGVLLVSLAKGQGGSAAETEKRTNAWNVAECAASAGLFLARVTPWETHELGGTMSAFGYRPTGRRGNDSSFRIEGALMHELTRAHLATTPLEYFPRDVAFFCPKEKEQPLEQLIACCLAVEGVVECALADTFTFPDGRRSVTLRMRFRGFFGWEGANQLQAAVAARLAEAHGVVVR
jgi:hypothetical protein